jgi:Zn-finger nucleic acid-binding protein
MNCPACNNPLIILELSSVEIDHCTNCSGIWLDGGELEILLENSSHKNELLASFMIDKNSSERRIKCPICRKKMEKVLCGKDENILIDRCRSHHGLWFDSGELEQLFESGGLDKEDKVLNLIKEMFGHKYKIN